MNSQHILKHLQPFFYHKQTPKEGKTLFSAKETAKAITDLFLHRNVRMKAPLPHHEQYLQMQSRIELSLKTDEAIPAIVQFGGAKTVNHCPYAEPDLSEWLALEQLARINMKVQAIYPPGLKLRLIIADSYCTYVFGHEEVGPYAKGMKKLIKALNLAFIAPVEMSSLARAFGEEKIRRRCQKNCQLLHAYWHTGTAESYQHLVHAGWKGILPQEQRYYYLKRARNIMSKRISDPEQLEQEAESSVIRFLAYALMIAQFDLLDRKNRRIVDISFVPLAPGEPKTLYKRFRIAPSPPGGTTRSAPPWTAQGILLWPDFRPSIYTHADFIEGKFVLLENFEILINGCTIRTDIFKKKENARNPEPI